MATAKARLALRALDFLFFNYHDIRGNRAWMI